jgi:ribosomal protein S11
LVRLIKLYLLLFLHVSGISGMYSGKESSTPAAAAAAVQLTDKQIKQKII